MIACTNCNSDGMFECIKFLIIAGADINIQTDKGNNVLLLCCKRSNEYSLKILELLVGSHIDINSQNCNNVGFNGLMMLCNNNTKYSAECAEYLIMCGINKDHNKSKNIQHYILLLRMYDNIRSKYYDL